MKLKLNSKDKNMLSQQIHFLLVWLILHVSCVFALQCDDAFECTDSILSDDDVHCDGFKACQNSILIEATSNDEDGIRSTGGYSCYHTNEMSSDDEIYCDGTASCANVTIAVASDIFGCDGVNSCQYSTIASTNDEIECLGEYSCYNTFITDTSKVTLSASYSGINAIIDSSNLNQMTVELIGYFAGYNSTIICNSGVICNIDCYGNGCVNTNVICDDSVSNCNINCNNGEFELDYNNTMYKKQPIEYPTTNDNIDLTSLTTLVEFNSICSDEDDTRTIICSGDEGCKRDILNLYDNNENVLCCIGDESCVRANIVINTNSSSSSSNTSNITHKIICMGRNGCNAATINFNININTTGTDIIPNVYQMYCQGYLTCENSTITNAKIVECSGDTSCQFGILSNNEIVLCTGFQSCTEAVLTNNDIIYATGESALKDAVINITSQSQSQLANTTIYLLSPAVADGARIICDVNINDTDVSTCKIICGVFGACINVDCVNDNCLFISDINSTDECPLVTKPNTTKITTTGAPTVIPTHVTTINSEIPNTSQVIVSTSTYSSMSTTKVGGSGSANTNNNTDRNLRKLSRIGNYCFIFIGSFFLLLGISGKIDAKSIRKYDLFNMSNVLFCATYTLDFVSGIYFLEWNVHIYCGFGLFLFIFWLCFRFFVCWTSIFIINKF